MIRSNRGTPLDMEALRRDSPHQIAITGGGIRMNAHGDIIDSQGNILKSAEDMDAEVEASTAGSSKVSLVDMRKVRDSDPELRAAAQRARKIAKKVEINQSAMVTNGQPIIRDYTQEEQDGTDSAPPQEEVIPLKRRKVSE